MHVEMMPIDAVTPYANNPRNNDRAVKRVAASLKAFGFRQPVVVDAARVIIVGHSRWRAARFLGMTEVPVLVAADLTPAQVRAYRIADNKTNEAAEWNEALLGHELNLLDDAAASGEPFDMTAFGFTQKEVDNLLGVGSTNGDAAAGAGGATATATHEVVVTCRDEAHQRQVYEQLIALGLAVRVITV